MTASPPSSDPTTSFTAPPAPNAESTPQATIDALTLQLRRKEGVWVEWGKACSTLQKTGMNPQQVFEATGFEPIQQNQLIAAAQVFDSM
ncbi:MAG: hypothetical protein WBA76_06110, partial [Phormidesmis sp.]